jgi:hypothetical protein
VPFESQGGLFADEAIQLLQQFYVCGNPQGVWRRETVCLQLLVMTLDCAALTQLHVQWVECWPASTLLACRP